MLFPRVSRPMTIIERYTAYENSNDNRFPTRIYRVIWEDA